MDDWSNRNLTLRNYNANSAYTHMRARTHTRLSPTVNRRGAIFFVPKPPAIAASARLSRAVERVHTQPVKFRDKCP